MFAPERLLCGLLVIIPVHAIQLAAPPREQRLLVQSGSVLHPLGVGFLPLNETAQLDLPVRGDAIGDAIELAAARISHEVVPSSQSAAETMNEDEVVGDADQQQLSQNSGTVIRPSVFVAIFSARTDTKRRGLIREMWDDADAGTHQVTAKFVICSKHDTAEDPPLDAALQRETSAYNDVLMLDCQEGYGNGKLTLKTLASMKVYLESYSDRALFMKTDDDTFINWDAFGKLVASRQGPTSFMGIPHKPHEPIRDPNDRWYEPYETFPGQMYPWSMGGGAGYILGGTLVSRLVSDLQHTTRPLLWNEDKAVAVQVNEIVRNGMHVDVVDIPGVDNQGNWHHIDKKLTWQHYKDSIIIHHHLDGEAIACLYKASKEGDPHRRIDACFGE